jgi:hypothetical protein
MNWLVVFFILFYSPFVLAIIPADYISQESANLYLLHTFRENGEGYVENIFEITAMRLRCVAQFFNEEHKVNFSITDLTSVLNHRNVQSSPVVMRRASIPILTSFTPIISPIISERTSRAGSVHTPVPSTDTVPTPASVESAPSRASVTSDDGMPDFR